MLCQTSKRWSSVGVSKVKEPASLRQALMMAAQYDRKILIEQFIDGREVECAVLGYDSPIASTVGEIIPAMNSMITGPNILTVIQKS